MILTLHTRNCGLEIAVTYIPSVVYVTGSDESYSDRALKIDPILLFRLSSYFPRNSISLVNQTLDKVSSLFDNKTIELLRIRTTQYYELRKYGHVSNLC